MDKKDLFSIGEMSKITYLGAKTLKYYETIGLLKPAYIDPENNYRYYSQDQLFKVILIKKYKIRGFSLKEIELILKAHNTDEILKSYEMMLNNIEEELKRLLKIKNEFAQRLTILQTIKTPPKKSSKNEIILKHLPDRWIIFKRSIAPYNNLVTSKRWLEMQNQVIDLDLDISDHYLHIIHTNYDELLKKSPDHEHAILLNKKPAQDRSFVRLLPESLHACLTYKGLYDSSLKAYHKLLHFIEISDYKTTGPLIRKFLTPYLFNADPEYFVTELQIPIEKKE